MKKEFYKSESDIYDSISNYIDSIFKSNNITEENLFVNKLDSKDKFHPLYGKKKLFLYLFHQSELFLKQIIWLFNKTTKALPSAKNVLFCSANTSNEELKAFLYRSVLCKNNQLLT